MRSAGRSYRVRTDDALYDIPPATARRTVARIRAETELRGGLRAVGDHKAKVRRVLLFPGAMPLGNDVARYTEMDMMVAGEVREWENTYLRRRHLHGG